MRVPSHKNHMEQLSFDSLLAETSEQKTSNNKVTGVTTKTNRKTFPIHLITDFERFMEYVEQHTIKLTDTNGYISRKHLPVMNDRMSVKAENATSYYSQQQFYPYIHLFFHIALSGKLTMKAGKGEQQRLDHTDRWYTFKHLTDTEKYFFLLETFWVDVNWTKLLNIKHSRIHDMLPIVAEKLLDKTSGPSLDLRKETLLANLIVDWHNLLLYFEWFGLWLTEKDQEAIDNDKKKNSYFAKTITLTDFGKKVLPILMNARNLLTWNIPLRQEYGEVNPIPGSALPEADDNQKRQRNRIQKPFIKPSHHYFQKGICINHYPEWSDHFKKAHIRLQSLSITVHGGKSFYPRIIQWTICTKSLLELSILMMIICILFSWMVSNGLMHVLLHPMIRQEAPMLLRQRSDPSGYIAGSAFCTYMIMVMRGSSLLVWKTSRKEPKNRLVRLFRKLSALVRSSTFSWMMIFKTRTFNEGAGF